MNKRPSISRMVSNQPIPKFVKVKQKFPDKKIERSDIPETIYNLLKRPELSSKIKKGMSIAITAGSRGIKNVDIITKSIADYVFSLGAKPFIVAAMGSHGGATSEGQREILESLGITEKYLGYPISTDMDVVPIGENAEGEEVYIDKQAHAADGIIVSCRIKPHTAFRGPFESGYMKMMAIGLGKQYGAEICHAAGFKHMAKNVESFGKTILDNCKILFGVATIENAYDETFKLTATNHDEINKCEPLLLKEAYKKMPKILLDNCDVLIVDKIGKNYSGDGMDPNIIGRYCTPYASGGLAPQRIGLLRLSAETRGNGVGIGLSDVITQTLADELDLSVMYANSLTHTVLNGIKIPFIAESDQDAFRTCIKTCNEIDKENPRIIRIPNTLEIDRILASVAYLPEIEQNPDLELVSGPFELEFNSKGDLNI